MDPLCHRHRYSYIFRSRGTYTRLYVSQKTNNYIANLRKFFSYQYFYSLKLVEIIDFLIEEIFVKSKLYLI